MKTIKVVLLLLVAIIFIGCGPKGPMLSYQGPLDTKVFKPIFLNTVDDGSSEILFKEFTTMYNKRDIKGFGVFVITDKSTYFTRWNINSFEYEIIYVVNNSNIKDLKNETIVREYWVDSDLLKIKDSNDLYTGFALDGKQAAYTILSKFIKKEK